MATAANIVAFDGAASPVEHTFVPISSVREGKDTIAEYRELNSALPTEAQNRIILKKTTLSNGVVRSSARVEVPVMEAISGQNAAGYTAAPRVAYVDTVEIVSYSTPRSTIAGKRLVRNLAVNIGNNVTTSVAAATSGPVPDLIDSLIVPT